MLGHNLNRGDKAQFSNAKFLSHDLNYGPLNSRGDLKSGLVWILNGRKVVGLQMIRIWNGI